MYPFRAAALLVPLLAAPAVCQDRPAAASDPTIGRALLVLDAGGHTSNLIRVTFSPDGKHLVTSAEDGTVRVWDARTGEPRNVIRVPGAMHPGGVALSRDGRTLAVSSVYPPLSPDGKTMIYLIAFPEGRLQKVINTGLPKSTLALAFSPDGKRVATATDDATVRLWATADGKPGAVFDTKTPVRSIAFSPDGGRLVEASTVGCGIRDLATGKLTPLTVQNPKTEPSVLPNAVAWSPDGKTIATCSLDGLQLWSATGKRLREGDPKVLASGATFSSDSRRLLVLDVGQNGNPIARLIDLPSGKDLLPLPKAPPPAAAGYIQHRAAALSPDGKLAAQLNYVNGVHAVRVWATADGKLVWRSAVPSWLPQTEVQAAWGRDGRTVSWLKAPTPAGGAAAPESFNLSSLAVGPTTAAAGQTAVLKQGPVALEMDKDSPSTIRVFKDGKFHTRMELPAPYRYRTTPGGVTLVGPGRAAVAFYGNGFFLFDTATGKLVRRCEGSGVLSLAPSPDGRFLLSLSTSQILSVFEATEGTLLLNMYAQGREWVVWTPKQGYYAATPGGERLIGWRVNNGVDQLPSYYPAEQFRKQLYRPDVIQLVLAKGGVNEAVAAANAARDGANVEIPKGETTPEKLLPPGVTLVVTDDTKLPRVTVRVTAQQSCPEQPVKSLRLLVDGRPLPEGQAAVAFPPGQEKAKHEVTWAVDLPPGRHKLAVLARSRDDTPSVSNAIDLISPAGEKDRPAVYHVAVGVNAYDQPKLALTAARGDAERLAEGIAAATRGGTAYQAKVPPAVLVDKAATRGAVLKAIEDVRRSGLRSGDLFVLSFAGHGVRENGEFFLLTREADPTSADSLRKTAISGSELSRALADFPCQVLLLLDACHAGAVGSHPPGSDEAARALSDVDVRVAVMCAALGHESALERDGAGLFTAAVVRALRHDPDVFYDRETGELNVYHLQAFVYQEVTKASDARQTPYLKMPLAQPAFTLARFR